MKKTLLFALALLWALTQSLTVGAQSSAVVRTMGQAELKPLPETPRQLLPRNFQAQKQLRREVRRVDADYKMPAQIYGLMVYSTKWPGGSGTGRYGVYTFTADKPNTMTAVVKDDLFAASGGAVYANGRLNVLNFTSLWGTIILDYDYYEYATQYWDELQHVHGDGVTRLMSAAAAYDPATENYYAAMYTDDMAHQVFGTLDYATNSRQVIRQLTDAENICAMAFGTDGTLYAIRFDGQLVTLNKNNGTATVIGSTGITPMYLQSAAIDPRTGRMFWAACSDTDPVGLYEVNLETGEASLIQQFAGSEEFVGLYIPLPDVAEDAPAAPAAITPHFTNDALQGTVNMRLPSKTYAGEAITDATLGYRVYIDGELAAEGEGEPGTIVRPEVAVAESKTYRFEACAVNGAGEGQRIHLDKFVGKDQPVAPKNVRLQKTDDEGGVKLTWAAPTTGVHDGYVTPADLNYTVVRMPDSVTVATHTTERSLTETLPTEQMVNYYYRVTPFNGDIEGQTAESNRLTLGSIVEVPWQEDFEDLSVVPNMFTFIDANRDGCTWRSGRWNGNGNADVYYQYNEDQVTPADDWLMTPPVHLKPGRFYTISFDLNGYFLGTEKVSAWMGDDKTAAAMTTRLLDTQVIDFSEQRNYSCLIKNDADGIRYFGFHAESDADQGILELDNIRIEENGLFDAPDTVTNFVVTPASYGARAATISFTAPVQDFYGNPITTLDKIELYRGTTLLTTIEAPEPGSEHVYEDKQLPGGNVTWNVYTYNSHGCGIPATVTQWIGTDIPTEPTDVTLTMVGTTARLTWNAPTTGVHNGYIRPSQLTYNIEDMNFYIKGDHRSGTTFTENRGAKQEFLYYRVSAQSSAGGGNYAYSNTVISGTPYKLPFHESFAAATTSQLWSQQVTGGQIGLTQSIAADGDQGAALYKPSAFGDVGMITSGKIRVSTAQHPILEFYYYAVPHQQTTLTVLVAPDGDAENLVPLGVVDYSKLTGQEGWRKVTYSLEDYVGTSHILLAFVGRTTGTRFGDIAFDAITVREQDDTDLAAVSLDVPSPVEASGTPVAVATILNNGRLAVADFKVRLTKNGQLLQEQQGHDLAAGAQVELTFDVPTSPADQEHCTLQATVVATGDAKADNDVAEAELLLQPSLYPAPEAPTGSEADGMLTISWAAPDLSPRDVTATDDVEPYKPFIIDGIGRWGVYDGDRQLTLALQTGEGNTVMYDHVGEPMAYQVFNAAQAGLDGVTSLMAHSGQQMLINMVEAYDATADDWLISPQLSGREQTVSFWVKSMGPNYIERFTVMASDAQAASQPDISTFTAVEASATEAPADWTQVTATLPAGTRHFAIRVHAQQKFMLMVDDLEYSPFNTADLQLLGYNVYMAGERLNDEPLTTSSFEVPWFGEADYRVTAVYQQGESPLSQPVAYVDGISTLTADRSPASSALYDLQGRRLARQPQPGIYIQNGQKKVVR